MEYAMSNKKQRRTGLPVIHEFAAGIDIGARFHVVAVPTDLAEEPIQTFQASPPIYNAWPIG